jgi:molecular chaperone GrpE
MKIDVKDGGAKDAGTKAGKDAAAAEAENLPVDEGPAPEETDQAAPAEDEKTFKEQLQRLAADFDNFRKRAAKENKDRFDDGVASLARRLLPVLDSLVLALDSAKAKHDLDALTRGIEMVRRLFEEGLEQAGVKAIDVSDGRFDPRFHETLFTEATAEVPPDTILLEVQKGYRLGDRLVRPTKVKTSVAPAPADGTCGGEGDTCADEGASGGE